MNMTCRMPRIRNDQTPSLKDTHTKCHPPYVCCLINDVHIQGTFIHYMQVRRPVTKFRSYFCMSFADSFSFSRKLVTPWVIRPTLTLSYTCSWHVPQLLYTSHQLHVRHLRWGSFRDHLAQFIQLRTCYVVWRRFSVMASTCTISRQHRKLNKKLPFNLHFSHITLSMFHTVLPSGVNGQQRAHLHLDNCPTPTIFISEITSRSHKRDRVRISWSNKHRITFWCMVDRAS